jgi:endonuclease/exonuclease/phosphatase family metal-dependent hydrolase
MAKIKLLTYNIAFGSGRNSGNYVKTFFGWTFPNFKNKQIIKRIGLFIKKQKPDVVCLQEVNEGSLKSLHVKQGEELEKTIGLKKVHAVKNMIFPLYLYLSNMTFANKKVCRTRELVLPSKIFNRSASLATLKTNNKKVTVINAHFSTVINDEVSRRMPVSRLAQIELLIDLINERENPIILCGDLNCDTSWKEYKLLKQQTGLQETLTQKTFPAWNPKYQLDHVMATQEIKIMKTKVLKSDLSDHLPVVSELRI